MGINTRTMCTTTLLALTVALSPIVHGANPEAKKASVHVPEVSKKTGPDGRRWIRARVLVHAPKDAVWNSVRDSRSRDPDLFHSRVLEKGEHHATVEEKMRLPLIGSEVYTLKVTHRPFDRIDYKLLKSSRLKAYEGNWQIADGDSDRSTVLQLEHHVRLAFFVPSFLLDAFVGRRVERRIMNVKRFAETEAIRPGATQ